MSSVLRRTFWSLGAGALLVIAAPGSSWASCASDCDGSGRVSIDELVMSVSVALEQMPSATCANADLNTDGKVSIDELLTGVGAALKGCQIVQPFANIQQVFSQSCGFTSCHSPLARRGGLVLSDEELSWGNLVYKAPENAEANEMGLWRVLPGDPERSYLIRKLRGMGPGDQMPQGTGQLPEETIHMIEDWILRGAPTTAEECSPQAGTGTGSHRGGIGSDAANCDGHTPPPTGNFQWQPEPPLPPPEAGKGIQLYVPPRDVAAGKEWETCYAFKLDPATLGSRFVERQEYRMHNGSHHLLLYYYFGDHPDDFAEGFFPCIAGNCINPGDCPADSGGKQIPMGGTQVAGTRYTVEYPPHVALPLLVNFTNPDVAPVIIANLHYTNPFIPAQDIYGEAWINLYFQELNEFKVILDGIFAINAGFAVEPYQTQTVTRDWRPRGILSPDFIDAAVFQLFGHMHKRATEFTIDFVDEAGKETQIYRTTEWDNAPVTQYPAPYLSVGKNERLRWTCTFENGRLGDPNYPPKKCHEGCNACGWRDADRQCHFRDGRVFAEGEPMPLVFGVLADDDMCNMFGYFIPQASVPLTQQ